MEFPTIEIRLRTMAKNFAASIALPENEMEQYIKSEFEKYLAGGAFESHLRECVSEAMTSAMKKAFNSWQVQEAMQEHIMKMFKKEE